MIESHLLLILHKKIQFYIFMFEAWNVAKGRKVQGGRILSQGTVSHWSPQKPIPPLVVFPSSSLLPMTVTNCKNHWSWRFPSPSLALRISCQSSSQITAPVHSPSVYSPSIYLPNPHTVLIYLSCSFAPQYLYLHIHLLHIYHSSV